MYCSIFLLFYFKCVTQSLNCDTDFSFFSDWATLIFLAHNFFTFSWFKFLQFVEDHISVYCLSCRNKQFKSRQPGNEVDRNFPFKLLLPESQSLNHRDLSQKSLVILKPIYQEKCNQINLLYSFHFYNFLKSLKI